MSEKRSLETILRVILESGKANWMRSWHLLEELEEITWVLLVLALALDSERAPYLDLQTHHPSYLQTLDASQILSHLNHAFHALLQLAYNQAPDVY